MHPPHPNHALCRACRYTLGGGEATGGRAELFSIKVLTLQDLHGREYMLGSIRNKHNFLFDARYRGAPLIRNSPLPEDHHRTLGIVLL